MKLEVGKSYRTRAGEKITIINVDDDRNYPFKGDNKNCYKENGRVWRYTEDEIDLIALWEGEPSAPTYKAGDIVEIQLTAKAAEALNLSLPCVICLEDVLLAVKDQEPEFDWSTAKAGMAFKFPKGISWYVGDDLHDKGWGVFALNKEWESFDSYYKSSKMIRTPEHDMEVK